MLYIFDKDGTLVEEINGRPPNKPEEQVLKAGVKEKIADLKSAQHKIAIASNQGGVAKRFITFDEAMLLMFDVVEKIGGANCFRICPHHPKISECNCRKPKPEMLLEIMWTLNIPQNETIMVGNDEVDRLAAEAAGVKFVWAVEFFGT